MGWNSCGRDSCHTKNKRPSDRPLEESETISGRLFRGRSGGAAAALLAALLATFLFLFTFSFIFILVLVLILVLILIACGGRAFAAAAGAGLRKRQARAEQQSEDKYCEPLHSLLSFKGDVRVVCCPAPGEDAPPGLTPWFSGPTLDTSGDVLATR